MIDLSKQETDRAVEYQYYDATTAGYPRPSVSLTPWLTWCMLGTGAGRQVNLVSADRPHRSFRRARYALKEAFRLCGVGDRTAVLLPALHCRTMLDPVIRLGAKIILYPVSENLEPDLGAIRQQMAQAAIPIKALLLTHYFGMPQNTGPIAQLCEEFGVALIEDCSHALFNRRRDPQVGLHGRYSVASPYKFLPMSEGGLLIAANTQVPLTEVPLHFNVLYEARSAINVVQRALARARVASPISLMPQEQATESIGGRFYSERSSETSGLYDQREEGKLPSLVDRMLLRFCDMDAIADARITNYRYWQDATRNLDFCRPLFYEWPDGAVPYMYPLILKEPDSAFPRLKRWGMPIWRWDEMALSECSVSRNYSHSLLHLPCHQSLTENELQWMVACLRRLM